MKEKECLVAIRRWSVHRAAVALAAWRRDVVMAMSRRIIYRRLISIFGWFGVILNYFKYFGSKVLLIIGAERLLVPAANELFDALGRLLMSRTFYPKYLKIITPNHP